MNYYKQMLQTAGVGLKQAQDLQAVTQQLDETLRARLAGMQSVDDVPLILRAQQINKTMLKVLVEIALLTQAIGARTQTPDYLQEIADYLESFEKV